MSVTQVYIVRHGETEENVAGILQGHLPGHLTRRGREQAATLCETLRGERFDAFFSSDLARAVETARIIAPAVGAPLQFTPLLRERDWGSLTGKAICEVRDATFPPNVETVAALFARARRVLAFFIKAHKGQCVLAVTHGLFARCLQAANAGVTIRDIPRMDNAAFVRLSIAPAFLSPSGASFSYNGASLSSSGASLSPNGASAASPTSTDVRATAN